VYEAASNLTAARRKELGAFYTPAVMASHLVRWAVRRPTDTVIDPSFGGLVFLRAAHDRLCELGASEVAAGRQIFGGEFDDQAHAAALGNPRLGASSARLVHGDFLGFAPGAELPLAPNVQ
jgi:adenine-specific DNA-methyltransferase